MPFFTGPVSSRGPIVDAVVMVSGARRAALERSERPIPEMRNVYALIDTGAACSAVDQAVLDELELTPTGEAEFLTPSTGSTPQMAATYDVVIGILAPRADDIHYVSDPLEVMAAELFAGQGIQVLIGRDVLANCFFQLNGADRTFTLAF